MITTKAERSCTSCGKPPSAVAFRPLSRRCRPCEYQAHRDTNIARNRAFRAKQPKTDDRRLNPLPRGRGPFDVTLPALEKLWGPCQTWTRAQHAKHSEWLRQLAGVKDEPLTRSLYAA